MPSCIFIIYASRGEGGPTRKDLGWDFFFTVITLDFGVGKMGSAVYLLHNMV